jgi:VWFA-related protein
MRNPTRSIRARVYALAGVLCLLPAAPHAAAPLQKTRTVYASITDKAGAPAANLTPADITIREDGQIREVVSVEPSATPVSVALLIDTSQVVQAMTQELRQSMTGFVTTLLKLSPDSTVSLTTFGDRPTAVRDFTSSEAVLTKDTGRLFPVTGSGSYLLDAILETTKTMKKLDAPHKAIVAFVDESGEEFSNASRQQVFDAAKDAGTSVWIVVLQSSGAATQTTEGRDRSAVIGDLPRQSGGTTVTILSKQGLSDKMKYLASLLAHEFAITYGRPDQLIPPSKFELTVSRKDVNILAPRWSGQ